MYFYRYRAGCGKLCGIGGLLIGHGNHGRAFLQSSNTHFLLINGNGGYGFIGRNRGNRYILHNQIIDLSLDDQRFCRIGNKHRCLTLIQRQLSAVSNLYGNCGTDPGCFGTILNVNGYGNHRLPDTFTCYGNNALCINGRSGYGCLV